MENRCAFQGCPSGNYIGKSQRDGEDGLITYYKFPQDKDLFEKWVKIVNRNGKLWQPDGSTRICSRHFEADDFVNNVCFDKDQSTLPNTSNLRNDAIPTILPNCYSNRMKIKAKNIKTTHISNSRTSIENPLTSSKDCLTLESNHKRKEQESLKSQLRLSKKEQLLSPPISDNKQASKQIRLSQNLATTGGTKIVLISKCKENEKSSKNNLCENEHGISNTKEVSTESNNTCVKNMVYLKDRKMIKICAKS